MPATSRAPARGGTAVEPRRDLHRFRVRPRPGGRGGRRGSAIVPLLVTFGSETFKAGVDLSTARVLGADGRPGRAVPEDGGVVAGRVQGGLRGGVRGGRRGDRLDPRRRHAVGHDQERPDRARHAARPRDPRRRFARRVDGRGDPRAAWRVELAAEGRSAAEIAEILEARAPDMRMYVALETLEYLKKGGRISGAQAAIGTLLSVKPIIRGQRTAWSTRSTGSGPAAKARERLIELICERPIERLAILHTISPDVEAFRDEVCARRRAASTRRTSRSASSARRSARTSARAASARRSCTGPEPRRRRGGSPARVKGRSPALMSDGPADRTLRQGCDNLADRYHRAGANRRIDGYTRAMDKSRAAVRHRSDGTRRRAPWGRPGDDPNRRRSIDPPDT